MSNTGPVLVFLLVLLLVAVLKFAWRRSVARSQPSRSGVDVDESDWYAVQLRSDGHDGDWGSWHHSDASHSHTSHSRTSHGDSSQSDSPQSDSGGGDGGDSSSD